MLVAADEVARSLEGSWALLQRDATGLRAFDSSAAGVRRSFSALLVSLPAFVVVLAAERARLGLLEPGTGLFDDPGLVIRLGLFFIAAWALPLGVIGLASWNAAARARATFVVACNWSGVLAALFAALPAFLLARDLATPALAGVYLAAFVCVVGHLRWFLARVALGLGGLAAALLVATDIGLEYALGHALALT